MANEINLVARMKDLASKQVDGLNKKLHGIKGAAGVAGHALLTLGKVLAGLAVAGLGALVVGMGLAIRKASDLNESMTKVQRVFGAKASAAIIRWSQTTARSLGISQQKALEAAGTFGNLFRAMKIGVTPASQMSRKLVTLAGDLASFNNANPEEVLLALRSGLVGESEPLRKFGINLTDARLRQEAVRLGLVKTTKEVLPAAAKAQAAYSLIVKDSTLAQGDFSRTSGGLANQQRIAAAVMEDSMAKIGTAVLPIVTKVLPILTEGIATVATFINDKIIPAVSGFYEKNKPLINQLIAFAGTVLVAIGTAIGDAATAIGTIIGKISDWLTANRPLVSMLSKWAGGVLSTVASIISHIAGFIGDVITAIAGWVDSISKNKGVMNTLRSIAGFIAEAVGNIATFIGDVVTAIGKWIGSIQKNKKVMDIFKRIVDGIATGFGLVSDAIGFTIDRIRDLIGWIQKAMDWLGRFNAITGNKPGGGPNAPYHPQYNPSGKKGAASGGFRPAGWTGLVGEQGQEMLTALPGGGIMVTPNRGGGSGGVVLNYAPTYSSASPAEAQAFAQVVLPGLVRELRRQRVIA